MDERTATVLLGLGIMDGVFSFLLHEGRSLMAETSRRGYKPYQIHVRPRVIGGVDADVMEIGFGTRQSNVQNRKDADGRLDELINVGAIRGGALLLVHGPSSQPVGMLIADKVFHRYDTVAVYDRQLHGGSVEEMMDFIVVRAEGDSPYKEEKVIRITRDQVQ